MTRMDQPSPPAPRRLIAYYFMGQDLCLVRRHLREDRAWMAEAGTDAVAVGVHEFQIDYGSQGGTVTVSASY